MAVFAKNESLYRRFSTKYKSRKLLWRILEDNKQNKHENRGKKTVWILRADRRFVLVCSTCCRNATNSFPPSLSFLPLNPCFFWWIISVNSCLLVSNLIIRWKPEKTKRLFKINTDHEGRRGIEFHYANYVNPISIIWYRHKIMYRLNRGFNIPPPHGIPRAFDTFAVPGRSNLVPRAFPSKNGWGGKRPWHRLVTCLLVHPKILGVIN